MRFKIKSKRVIGLAILLASFLLETFPPAWAALSIDGSGCTGKITSGSSVSCSITTSNTNDVIIINVGTLMGFNAACNGSGGGIITVSSITVGGSSSTVRQTKTQNAACMDIEEWYFVSAGTLSGASIAVTLSGNIATAGDIAYITAFAVSGANTGTPFDGNAGAKCSASGSGTSTGCNVTTSNANDMLIGALIQYARSMAVGSGYTLASSGSDVTTNTQQDSEYQIVSATQSGTPVNWTWGGTLNYDLLGDAIQQAATTVTLPIKCTIAEASHTNANFAVSGGSPSPSPSTITCSSAGTTTNVVVQQSTSITVTVPTDNASTRFRWSDRGTAVTTWSITSCASGTCSTSANTTYYQLKNNYAMIPVAATTWDAAYSEPLTGTFLGSTVTLATFSLTNGGGKVTQSNIWADSQNAVDTVSIFTATGGCSCSWSGNTTAWTDTTGGHTHNAGYWQQYRPTFQINAKALAQFTAGMTLQITGLSLGVAGSNICLITTTAAASDSCNGLIDSGGNATFAQFLSGPPANTQWQNSNGAAQTINDIVSSGTFNAYYYAQYKQTVSFSITCASGASCSALHPVIHYQSVATASTITLTGSNQNIFADAGSSANITPVTFTDNLGNGYGVSPTSWTSSAPLVFTNPDVYSPNSIVTQTITITGWLAPDSAHFSNSFLVMLLPLMGMAFLTLMVRMFKVTGDVGVYFALGGLTAGSVLADLSATATATNAVPFADALVAGLLLFLFWWNS